MNRELGSLLPAIVTAGQLNAALATPHGHSHSASQPEANSHGEYATWLSQATATA